MDFKEEIRCRDEIMSRIRNGEKVAPEDRLWLVTHPLYNWFLGYPYLNSDIIYLHSKVSYCIRVKVETLIYPRLILPVITVPGGKGAIVTSYPLINYRGNVTIGKPVKMLAVPVYLNQDETEFTYRSSLGLLGVSFLCDYFDDKQRLTIRKDSDVGDPDFAMQKEVLSDSKVLYRCKTPGSENFGSYAFSIEWKPLEKKK
ncbi:MAG: hypothetical protein E7663_00070 [Ruminococcaceae bacterium]|nr:hypothetical protein [Oscillospiraceae bacterium]